MMHKSGGDREGERPRSPPRAGRGTRTEDFGCGAGRDLSGTERRTGFRRAAGVRECAGPGY